MLKTYLLALSSWALFCPSGAGDACVGPSLS